ncbi:acetolactate synthase large subunit [Pseudorhodobacter sp.]|uniref:acetolactate synthase large subunit n=1 Tax=Pseudorhodobacter sp. TaxID=1934400 RepID=UPI002648069E|nr:acetolactate synthase large subunit [Pseudorhodobacter sp.]MDN5785818.1 acetolactate synthase large subunit [Pseudorhodobacter sp.]
MFFVARTENVELLDRIAQKTGARLMAQQANARLQRGARRVNIDQVPYVIDQAVATFAGTEQVILIGAKAPVVFFAYPGKPGSMLPEDCEVLTLVDASGDIPGAIAALADALGAASAAAPRVMQRQAPDVLRGTLTPDAISIALARHMPDNSIICDESITSRRQFFQHTDGASPHDLLQLTGGAIGHGLPAATGAAVACPDRKVIALQADGSGMYRLQALWTQAREQLDVLTIIFANRRYQILHGELANVGAGTPGRNASPMLDRDNPELGWVHLAKGMGVEGARVETVAAFVDVLKSALARKGPFLIEAMI